jgi:hypothetical protein
MEMNSPIVIAINSNSAEVSDGLVPVVLLVENGEDPAEAEGDEDAAVVVDGVLGATEEEEDEQAAEDGNVLCVEEDEGQLGGGDEQHGVPGEGLGLEVDLVKVEAADGDVLGDIEGGEGAADGDVGDEDGEGEEVESAGGAVGAGGGGAVGGEDAAGGLAEDAVAAPGDDWGC